jgi:hypothetical protein
MFAAHDILCVKRFVVWVSECENFELLSITYIYIYISSSISQQSGTQMRLCDARQ